MSLRSLITRERGDTIIEVMICMAVAGAAISAAYSISSRSLNRVRQSQERTESLKLAEQQLERLKKVAKDNPGKYTVAGGTFNFYRITASPSDLRLPPLPQYQVFCIDASLSLQGPLNAGDLKNEANNTCREPSPYDRYKSGIVYDAASSENKFYIFSGRLTVNPSESSNANQFDVVPIMYRMHP
jgi:type II secretory pathway pseudopilin PulG